ncbi:unnamed protein product [Paramecium primaurelia]|uniref:Uncharacterized protein n=1 Tax=Paramecium primaurelia TaxID=5886 RepID=A0A8S1PA43_PARPR|nr:unnamed protein product [Paramecium primaurelia]
MGTACSLNQQFIEQSPQIILNHFDIKAYPLQYNAKLYTHCPTKQEISKVLVQQSKENIDEEQPSDSSGSFLECSHRRTESQNTQRNSLDFSINNTEVHKKGILRQPHSLKTISQKSVQQRQKKKVHFQKSKFVQM